MSKTERRYEGLPLSFVLFTFGHEQADSQYSSQTLAVQSGFFQKRTLFDRQNLFGAPQTLLSARANLEV
jgi:hypothetical protein